MEDAVTFTGTAVMLGLMQWIPAIVIRLLSGTFKSYGAWIGATLAIAAIAYVVGVKSGLDVDAAANWIVPTMLGTAAIFYPYGMKWKPGN